ncbi:4402_t:CDS:2 [Funneliformis geosporum]|uniref:2478_t:CDS:1 n=1 Tax=Funneliformis geosporum TaxID=1117311 RepID=A0A9W4WVT2_9GLOM|nr:4402_t:CDS:2 [Funneliformis geosporum]CAI2182743.1 2478_t:CDS:2 [Funneliformis geosporum]
MSSGKLEVHIVQGRGIKDMDTVGQGDPYVELWLDEDSSTKHKTDSRSGTNTPVWDKYFHYFVKNHKELHLRLLDEDVGASELIGVCSIPLADVYEKRYVDQWVHLPDKKSQESNGEVRVILEYWPTNI